MSLTGTGIRIGTVTAFGVSISFPRGLASDGTTPYLFDANKGYTLNPTTGAAVRIGTETNFAIEESQCRAATYDGTNILFYGNALKTIYSYNTTTGVATPVVAGITDTNGNTTFDLRGIAWLNSVLYGIDRISNALYTVNYTNRQIVRVGNSTNFGIAAGNFFGFTAYRGELLAVDGRLRKLIRINATTGVGTIVQAEGALPDFSPEALSEHNGQLWMAGSFADALFRFYDVRWDETIADLEVNEGTNLTYDLSGVSEDASSFAFHTGYTVPSWMAITGNNLVVTGAPAVSVDTEYSPRINAIRAITADDNLLVDKTLTLFVRNVGTTPPPPLNPPTFTAPAANYEVNERANSTIDATEFFTGHTRLAFQTGSTVPSWLTISGLNVVITDAPDVLEDTEFTVPLTATNNDGSVNGSLTISVQQIDPAPVFGTPNRFDIDEGSSSVFDLSGDLQNTESLAYQSGYSAPSWLTISGLTLVITNAEQVSQDTDFDVLLAAESTKTAATADRTVTIRVREVAVPPPPPPLTDAVLDISVNPSSVTAGGIATVTFTFDKVVTGFTDADASVSAGATKGTLRAEGNNAWTLPITAPSAGSGTVTVSVGADVVSPGNNADSVQFTYTAPPPPPPMLTTPGAPTSLSLSSTHNSITANWGAPSNTGGENPSRYDIRIDGGGWIDTGLDGTHTFDSLSPETEYTVEVAAVNSEGRGTPASRTRRTDAAPIVVTVPGAPTSLSFTVTHNSIVAMWGVPADNGNEDPSRYDIRIDGGGWIDTGLDGTHTFDSLSPNTEYTINVAAVNSAGRGTPARGNPQRTEMPPVIVPDAPTGLKVDLKPTTAVIRWAAVDGIDGYEVSYAEGASLGTTWIATGSTGTRFFVKELKRGTQYTFAVRGRNSEGAGATSRAVTQKTPIASLHNALFFKECVNYFDNGGRVSEHGNPSNIIREVADNDYQTFSNVTDYAIDMSRNNQPTRVDAVFIKSKGITQHSGTPTGGSGTGWTNEALPETVKNWEGTEVSTTVAGFQHHLYLLDSHFTATSVRVRFEGTNVELYEIMLLEFGISIDANGDFTEIATNFVDREGVIHSDPGGGIAYDASIGDQRDKWEVDYVVRVVPGKTMLETPEDFLYWRAKNRNHVFCMEPSRFPWRIFPAVFVGKSVPVRYRTDDKIGGEILNFRVAEQ